MALNVTPSMMTTTLKRFYVVLLEQHILILLNLVVGK